MNDHLKKLGKMAGFNEAVKVLKYFDDREVESFLPFYDILTTHVARKSYITNSLTLGVPECIVREISGHKDEKSFVRYVKLAESFKNQAVQKAFREKNIEKYI